MEFLKTFEEARPFGMVAEQKAPRNPKTPKVTEDTKTLRTLQKGGRVMKIRSIKTHEKV